MNILALVAEFVGGGTANDRSSLVAATTSEASSRQPQPHLPAYLPVENVSVDGTKSQNARKEAQPPKLRCQHNRTTSLHKERFQDNHEAFDKYKKREAYKESLQRELQHGYEINIENEDVDVSSHGQAQRWTVSYKSDPLRRTNLLVNVPKDEHYRICWKSEHKGDTAFMAYNYDTFFGHNANWMISGSGGPVSITSRGKLSECDFEQENDLTIRSDVRSRPVETDLKGAIRINYLTDNVDFQWKGAVRYPILGNAVKISHGVETQEIFGCCWTMKAEKKTDELAWKSVGVETTGQMASTFPKAEQIRAAVIRNLKGPYDFEIEAKNPFSRRGTKWTTRLKRKKRRGIEHEMNITGEDTRFRSMTVRSSYAPVENTRVSWSTGYQPINGWNMSVEAKLGKERPGETSQNWKLKAELRTSEGFRRRQADISLFIPLNSPVSF